MLMGVRGTSSYQALFTSLYKNKVLFNRIGVSPSKILKVFGTRKSQKNQDTDTTGIQQKIIFINFFICNLYGKKMFFYLLLYFYFYLLPWVRRRWAPGLQVFNRSLSPYGVTRCVLGLRDNRAKISL